MLLFFYSLSVKGAGSVSLKIDDLSFSYGRELLLQKVSFSADPGKLTAVLGNNGAGKSTLLKCIARILEGASGSFSLSDTKLHLLSRRELAKRVSYVAQRPLGNDLSVYDTILLGRRPYIRWEASQEDHKIVDSLLQDLSLSSLALRRTDTLSGGELQKVVLARALAVSPQLLLLDEPTSALDLKNQLEVLSMVQHLAADRNMIVLCVLHDLNLALRYCEHFLLLQAGKLLATVTRNELTPDLLEQVYNVPVRMESFEGRPIVLPK